MKLKLMIAAFGLFVLTAMGQGWVADVSPNGTAFNISMFTSYGDLDTAMAASEAARGTTHGVAVYYSGTGLTDFTTWATGNLTLPSVSDWYEITHTTTKYFGRFVDPVTGLIGNSLLYNTADLANSATITMAQAAGAFNPTIVPEPAPVFFCLLLAAMWWMFCKVNSNQHSTLRRVGGLLRSPLSWFPGLSIGCSTVKKLLQRLVSVGQGSGKLGMTTGNLQGHGGM